MTGREMRKEEDVIILSYFGRVIQDDWTLQQVCSGMRALVSHVIGILYR